jgi:transposase-like protein
MPRKKAPATPKSRRSFSEEFRQEAVQMLLDGHSAASAERVNDFETLTFGI